MDWNSLFYALTLLALGVGLLLAEFFIVSFGLLLMGAIACVAGAFYFAFAASDAVGWAFVLIVPLLIAGITRWGIHRVQQSHVVPRAQVTADAGYHHVADLIHVSVGSEGVMVTPAYPSGRARFEGGELDVQSRGRALQRNAQVRVVEIDGPNIFVDPLFADTIDAKQA